MANANNQSKAILIFKPTLLFFSALVTNFILHELSHAIAAYLLHIKSSMYQLYVNPDSAHASLSQNIIIAATGPVFSLCLGLLFWWVYKKQSFSSIKLFSLYGAITGVNIFFGNVFATSFAGDFHNVELFINLRQTVCYIISGIGLLALITFMFYMGKQLMLFYLPFKTTKATMILYMIVMPVILGIALLLLTYSPLPPNSIPNRIIESMFWIFAVIGALRFKQEENTLKTNLSQMNWFDISLTIGVIIVVRIMARGIDFNP